VPRLIARPLRIFLSTEAAGGVVLLVAALLALVWANSPVAESYESFWHTEVGFRAGALQISQDLRHWVNDGLMTIFFFVVGLEIKRELVVGELNDARKATLPIVAAVGGMLGPALLYAAIAGDTEAASGWGIPMATDIAFAVGVLSLLSRRVPAGIKVFLLSVAIVDDIGAILVIALFYSGGLDPSWLIVAAGALGLVVVLRRLRVFWVPVYLAVGVIAWLATFESGVHATIAGVALGLLTPARATDPHGFTDVLQRAQQLPAEPDAESLRALEIQSNEVVSVAERLEHRLHPWTSYVVIPVFALANAGVRLGSFRDAFASRVAVAVIVGLVVGKLVGISASAWLATRLNIGRLPEGVEWRHLLGAAAVAGIGFTVSLFITNLAFTDDGLIAQAKLGILVGSVIAGVVGAVLLARPARRHGYDTAP